MKHYPNKTSGYTLVDVLLVVTIIGLLSSSLLVNLQESRQNSRDASMKQMARTTATIFEYNRNELGSYLHYNLQEVGNNGTSDTCSDKAWQGPYANRLERLCEGIVGNAEYESNAVLTYVVSNSLRDGNSFSIMVQLHDGNWYCVGSNGGASQGPLNANAKGCSANP